MSKNTNLLPVMPNGFLELPKAWVPNKEHSKLLITIAEIALVESNGQYTEVTLKNGKVVATSATVKDVKQSILMAQLQRKGVTLEVDKKLPETKTKLLTWLAHQPKVSIQLTKAMRNAEAELGVEYVEELPKDQFLKIKGIGKQTWFEFVRLRGY